MSAHYILPLTDDTTPALPVREFPVCVPSNDIAYVNMKLAAEGAALVMIMNARAAQRS